jgi:haloalkane dehalogenase
MKIIKTPLERFDGLPDYPYSPHWASVTNPDGGEPLDLHYVDEGPHDAPETLLFMHGEPTWSYLYRKMIKTVRDKEPGFRVLAPDMPGFGKSDKPAAREDYTYERLVDWMSEWLTHLDLNGMTLFCQDWGGLVGLRLVARFPERFERVMVSNTGLPTGGGRMTESVKQWRDEISQTLPSWEDAMQYSTVSTLTKEVLAAYEAPFPTEEHRTGSRVLPRLIPVFDDEPSVKENIEAWKVLERFEKPFMTAFGDSDPASPVGKSDKIFQDRVPGAKGQNHTVVEKAGHFIQEDKGPEVAELLLRFIKDNQQ